MAQAVARAIAEQRHLVVQAGTGTGKSLAYLVPAALAGQRVVVATATKALQDQLATKDLPLVAGRRRDLSFAVLKGRSNYLCRQRSSRSAAAASSSSLSPDGPIRPMPTTPRPPRPATTRWRRPSGRPGPAAGPLVGGDHPRRPGRARLRTALPGVGRGSTTARECPGAFRCPSGRDCFAEGARSPGRRRPTWWWSTPTSTAPIWPAGVPYSPPTTWSSSTRPTRWRTS